MFRITFTNELGKIEMGGGRHPNMNITSVSGFSNPKKEFKTVSFSGQPGMFTTSERELSRTMILAGNFFGTAAELNKIYTVLSKAGILTVYFHLQKREIPCRCTDGDEFTRLGKNGMYRFAISFQSDTPYFTDCAFTSIPIFSREDLISGTFTLPCVFTRRICSVNVKNRGDKSVYPIISVVGMNPQSDRNDTLSLAENETGIYIKNDTSDAFIHLKHTVSVGERITVDVINRKITSNMYGNITNKISDDTVLSDFILLKNDNQIECINFDTAVALSAEISFKNEYRTAVY